MNSRILLLVSAFGLVACGDDPAFYAPDGAGSDAGTDLVRRGLDEFDRLAVGTCRCAPEFSMDTVTEAMCLSDFRENLPTESETQCIEGVYEGASDADLAAAECQLDALSAWADCSEDAACNNAVFIACQDAYEAADARCPEVSAALETMSDACFPDDETPPST